MGLATTPRTWVAGETVTAALMNTEVRDALTGIQAAWTSYSPALTAVTTNPTLGTGGSTTGSYIQIGKTVIGRFIVTFGTAGTNAGSGAYSVSLPVAPVAACFTADGRLFCAGVSTRFQGIAQTSATLSLRYYTLAVGGSNANVAHNTPGAWTINDNIQGWFIYESA